MMARESVVNLLDFWTASGQLTYKYHVAYPSKTDPNFIRVTFSKPTEQKPSPDAVAHYTFVTKETSGRVEGFKVENDPHLFRLSEISFQEKMIDRTIKLKLNVRRFLEKMEPQLFTQL